MEEGREGKLWLGYKTKKQSQGKEREGIKSKTLGLRL